MNTIERLNDIIKTKFPKIKSRLDPPDVPSGSWWLDLKIDNFSIVIGWRKDFGYHASITEDII